MTEDRIRLHMTLSAYHQKYLSRSEEDMDLRVRAKEHELEQIFKEISFEPSHVPVRIAVMGCGHKRFVRAHRETFARVLGKPVELTTFDITVDHLVGEERVVQHDCTLPLPNTPYEITLAHVVLKFIPTEKQWPLIQNSYDALSIGGMAIHVFDEDDLDLSTSPREGYFKVSLEDYKKKIEEQGIGFQEMRIKTGPDMQEEALVLILKK
jgi:hypothetical protein